MMAFDLRTKDGGRMEMRWAPRVHNGWTASWQSVWTCNTSTHTLRAYIGAIDNNPLFCPGLSSTQAGSLIWLVSTMDTNINTFTGTNGMDIHYSMASRYMCKGWCITTPRYEQFKAQTGLKPTNFFLLCHPTRPICQTGSGKHTLKLSKAATVMSLQKKQGASRKEWPSLCPPSGYRCLSMQCSNSKYSNIIRCMKLQTDINGKQNTSSSLSNWYSHLTSSCLKDERNNHLSLSLSLFLFLSPCLLIALSPESYSVLIWNSLARWWLEMSRYLKNLEASSWTFREFTEFARSQEHRPTRLVVRKRAESSKCVPPTSSPLLASFADS